MDRAKRIATAILLVLFAGLLSLLYHEGYGKHRFSISEADLQAAFEKNVAADPHIKNAEIHFNGYKVLIEALVEDRDKTVAKVTVRGVPYYGGLRNHFYLREILQDVDIVKPGSTNDASRQGRLVQYAEGAFEKITAAAASPDIAETKWRYFNNVEVSDNQLVIEYSFARATWRVALTVGVSFFVIMFLVGIWKYPWLFLFFLVLES